MNGNNDNVKLRVSDMPSHFYFAITYPEGAEDQQAADQAKFPKYARVRFTALSCHRGDNYLDGYSKPFTTVRIGLSATKANKGVNETGLKRRAAIVKVLKKLGYKQEQER